MSALQNDPNGDPKEETSSSPERAGNSGGGMTPSESPNNSYETGAGEENSGFDSPPVSTLTLGNKDIEELDKKKPGDSSAGEVHGDAQPDVTANHKIPGNEQ